MQPALSATYTASQLGLAQIADGVAVVVSSGMADLVICEQGQNRVRTVDIGAVFSPGSGYFVTESPPGANGWSMVQASQGMALHMSGSVSQLYLFGAGGALSMSVLGAGGLPGTAQAVTTSQGNLTGVKSFTVIPDAAGDLTAVSKGGAKGFEVFTINGNGALTLTDIVGDSVKSYVEDVVGSASVQLGGEAFLVTISTKEAGLTSYSVSGNSDTSLIDSLGNHDGLAIAGAQALQTATTGGQTFAIIASVTSSSLSTVRINDMGCLFVADHVVDDLGSRIRGASALDVFEINGRVLIVAGGSDAGLTTYELLPGGGLYQMNATAFERGQGMGNIASIDTAANGDIVSIYVTEEAGTRLQVFQADYSDLGALIQATSGTTTGTALDDRIFGRASADTLNGGNGDDFLHDGAGADRLSGGGGADVFVLCADGSTDTITDFQNGMDRIDLSDWGRIYTSSVLTITGTSTGAQISYGRNILIVTSATGGSLGSNALTDDDFIF
jgi:serralysin